MVKDQLKEQVITEQVALGRLKVATERIKDLLFELNITKSRADYAFATLNDLKTGRDNED